MVSRRLVRFIPAALLPMLLLPRPAGAAGEPWDEPFTALPAALLRAAEAVPVEEGSSVVVLLEEGRFSFESDGRQTYRYRIVYRILSPEGVKNWASVEAAWSPWHQQRPELRARVCARDGREHLLDPATVGEAPVHEQSAEILSDTRLLRAPLPAVAVGTIVEQEVVIRERAPFFAGGVVQSFLFGKAVPVHRTRLVIEAPPSLPLRHVTRLLPSVQPRRENVAGLVRLSFESGPLEALPSVEDALPPELPRRPRVTFSTGASWAAVAAQYQSLVEAQLRRADVAAVARKAAAGARDRNTTISRLLEHLQAEVRYTGIEFGQGSIVPRNPGETLQTKYGDCKDQATLLVALLRASGIEAQIALLRPGLDEDVEAELPGLGDFSHAIVHVPGTPSVWIDPTVKFGRAADLPAPDQGRLALLASSGSRGLVRTPEVRSQANRVVETREFFLARSGPARVVETTEAWGSFEQSYRDGYLTADGKALRDQLEQYVKAEYAATALTAFEHSKPQDLSRPFRLRLEVSEAKRGLTDTDGAAVLVRPAELTRSLPPPLSPSVIAGEGGQDEHRHGDYLLPQAFISEHLYRIVPPPGFAPARLPESGTSTLGPARLSQQWALGADGVVTGALRFEIAKRRLTPSEFEQLRDEVRRLRQAEGITVRFEVGEEPRLKANPPREGFQKSPAAAASPAAALASPSLPPEVLLLPADSDLLMGLDVRGLLASRFWNELTSGRLSGLDAEQAKAARELRSSFGDAMKEVETETGMRADRDVDRLYMAFREAPAPTPEGVGLVLGRFDAARMVASMEATEKKAGRELARKTLGAVTVLRATGRAKQGFALAFLSDRSFLFGDPLLVESTVMAHNARRPPLEANTALAAQLRAVKPEVGLFVLVGKDLLDRIPKGGTSALSMPPPRSLALFSRFDGPTQIIAEMATEAEARNLADIAQGGLAMARMKAAQAAELQKVPGLREVLDGITVEAAATTVRLSTSREHGGAGVGLLGALAMPSLLRARAAAKQGTDLGGESGGLVVPPPAPPPRAGGAIPEPKKSKP